MKTLLIRAGVVAALCAALWAMNTCSTDRAMREAAQRNGGRP